MSNAVPRPEPALLLLGLLRQHQVGDVERGAQAGRPATILDQAAGKVHPARFARPGDDAEGVARGHGLAALAGHPALAHHLPVVRVHHLPEVHADQFVGRVAGDLFGHFIDITKDIVLVNEDGRGGGLGERAELRLALPQRAGDARLVLLDAALGGDVPTAAAAAPGGPVGRVHRGAGVRHPAHRAIAVDDAELRLVGPAGGRHLALVFVPDRPVGRIDDLADQAGPAHELGRGIAGDAFARGGAVEELLVRPDPELPGVSVFRDDAQPRFRFGARGQLGLQAGVGLA